MNFDPIASRAGLTRRALLGMSAIAVAFVAGHPLLAQVALNEGSVAAKVEDMRPGDYLWAPEAAPEGPVIVVISLAKQRAYVYRNGVLIGISTASTGTAGHETPTGVFTILQKKVDHKSNLYNDAPMPFMQRLTWTGIAMHAGNLPGYPASHGCIRLPLAFAKRLYAVTQIGLTVIITESPNVPRFAPAPQILQERSRSSFDAAFVPTWQPDKAPTGPVSIIVSASDQRAVVLRNGIEIGTAPVSIRGTVAGLQAFTLASIDQRGTHWMFLPMLGNTRTGEVSREDRDRLDLPEDFRRKLLTVLKPGSTLIVTPDTLQSGSTGAPLTVLTSEDSD
ncbi:L,D-transpeptidase [Novosphingobium album (ex Liu et al. 2023)]|uniref:L,D-transpeptidase n=1 Tax=Novosphingobium album (ex Liu et al. 2023) TaxID=3031130 RepID=A0ABT5WS30_9SPHN|nr:L,D-transpeptidase [Novosphingobium album (ex Liu et al. 2023)]MDE8652865.1 L,D-transpeptidase [Novosphingobium album (ex Liu et al. 2023)]